MRVKRQRKKLRGKYSGNCLSCTAKWSKCWYIASVDNQFEWQSRLSIDVVTPGEDEVCFQCWDAKIRTSPKRKMHFKVELPSLANSSDDSGNSSAVAATNMPYLRPAKCVDYRRNKKPRLVREAYTYSVDSHSIVSETTTAILESKREDDDADDEEELYAFIDDDDSDGGNDGAMFDEENAVILLSTAFRTIPHQNNSTLDIINMRATSADDMIEDMKSKKRGAYYCGKCGKLKKGHICTEEQQRSPADQSLPQQSPPLLVSSCESSPSLAALSGQPPFALEHRAHSSTLSTVLAQPVVS